MYKKGHTPVGPADGKVEWSGFHPYGADLPGEGSWTLRKTYRRNVMLLYIVSGRKSIEYADFGGHPPSPNALYLLDETLSSITGTGQGTGTGCC